jgi:hypothetical protein
MNFGISLELDSEVEKISPIINAISRSLFEELKIKDYGLGLQNFTIGIICVLERKGYEDWFKARKPKYSASKQIRRLDKSLVNKESTFTYDIKLNAAYILDHDEIEIKKYIVSEILKSLSNLDYLTEKVKDFEIERFKIDFENFLNYQKHFNS